MRRFSKAVISSLILMMFVMGGLRANPPAGGAEKAIGAVLSAQVEAWNRGDVTAFMQGYWKSDQTEFVGANGILRGWQSVLDRYRKTYPDRRAMGTLAFSDLEVTLLSSRAALVVGRFHLVRQSDHPEGVFTLVFRKFPEGWRIINDHTSAVPKP
ncbi:MAG TPA: nuclear transport factor 2 family protein [Terriglobia bacterium]|nr:nuclear transport factor 2 family protein [Terriglobia bacterium]